MDIRFVFEDQSVLYSSNARVPVVGEKIITDGSDPGFAPGVYCVCDVSFLTTIRGPQIALCELVRLHDNYPGSKPISLTNEETLSWHGQPAAASTRGPVPIEQVVRLAKAGKSLSHADSASLDGASSYASYHKEDEALARIDAEIVLLYETQPQLDQKATAVKQAKSVLERMHSASSSDRFLAQEARAAAMLLLRAFPEVQ
jgi:hypothetical protein